MECVAGGSATLGYSQPLGGAGAQSARRRGLHTRAETLGRVWAGHTWAVRWAAGSKAGTVSLALLTCHPQLQWVTASWPASFRPVVTVVSPHVGVCHLLEGELGHLWGSLWVSPRPQLPRLFMK